MKREITMKRTSLEAVDHQKFRDRGPRRILELDHLRDVQCRVFQLINDLIEHRNRHKVSMKRKRKKVEERNSWV